MVQLPECAGSLPPESQLTSIASAKLSACRCQPATARGKAMLHVLIASDACTCRTQLLLRTLGDALVVWHGATCGSAPHSPSGLEVFSAFGTQLWALGRGLSLETDDTHPAAPSPVGAPIASSGSKRAPPHRPAPVAAAFFVFPRTKGALLQSPREIRDWRLPSRRI